MRYWLLTVSFLVALSNQVWADFQGGLQAYKRGDYAVALREWQPYAKKGDVRAQYNLGVMYASGQGVAQDYAEALKWYQLAARQGYGPAQFNVGQFYEFGVSVSQNYTEAAKWYRLAAEQGRFDAQKNLGALYYNGQGVPQDFVQAYRWLYLAAKAGHTEAASSLDIVARNMTSDQIAEAKRLTANIASGTRATGWKALSYNDIRIVQRALNAAGFDAGPADGQVGNRTRSALSAFQRSKGLPVGEPDQATLQALGVR